MSTSNINEARFDILAALNELKAPITRKQLKALDWSPNTRKYFNEAVKQGEHKGEIYATTKGLLHRNNIDLLSESERASHLKYVLSNFQYLTPQYVLDRDLIERLPKIIKTYLTSGSRSDVERANYMQDRIHQLEEMSNNVSELFQAHNRAIGALEAELNKIPGHSTKKKIGEGLEALKNIRFDKEDLKRRSIKCNKCGSMSIKLYLPDKKMFKCDECNDIFTFYD
jgi:hypothetical protein